MIIQSNYSLKHCNTFGVDQYAAAFGIIQSLDDLNQIRESDQPVLILGGGSNILLTKDIDALILKNELKGKSIVYEDDQDVFIQLKSGENWHECVTWAVEQGWGGIENLSLIPGTVGAAPIQNIGAYGAEIKDVLIELNAYDFDSKSEISFNHLKCMFGYRDSIFKNIKNKGKYFITSVLLKLSKHPIPNTKYADIERKLAEKNILHPTIKDVHEAVIEVRQYKLPDPAVIGNAGSFFKNPIITLHQYDQLKKINPDAAHYPVDSNHVKIPAGWLIDQAGWKGKSIGHVGCYEKQALVIINNGGASGDEIWKFAQGVQEDVMNKYGILIEPEINIW